MANRFLESIGNDRDVVLCTRVCLSRNLPGFPFPASMTADQRHTLIGTVTKPLSSRGLARLPWEEYSADKRQSLAERFLVSMPFALSTEPVALFCSADESVSVAVAGQDHIRLQVLLSGLSLSEAYAKADEQDTALDADLHFAFDTRLGYLTQSPADLGTAMHASVFLHLPALQGTRFIFELGNMVSKLGLSLQSVYGENGKSSSALYRLSNRVTLGISEQAAISNLEGLALQIVRQERAAREELAKTPQLEDRVWRSMAILQHARMMGVEEFRSLWSTARLGVSQGLLNGVGFAALDTLLTDTGNAAVALLAETAEEVKQEICRATIIRERV